MFFHADDIEKINADLLVYICYSYCHNGIWEFPMENLLIVRSTELGKKNMVLPEKVMCCLAASERKKLF